MFVTIIAEPLLLISPHEYHISKRTDILSFCARIAVYMEML